MTEAKLSRPTLYISYRRAFSAALALALYQGLRAQGFDVYMAVGRDIRDMRDTRDALDQAQIEARTHFLPLLTSALVEPFQDADDPMRREIEFAVSKRRLIVPLLTNGFSFNHAVLPPSALRHDYGLVLTTDALDQAVAALQDRLSSGHFFGKIAPTPTDQQAEVERRSAETDNQPMPTPDQLRAEALFNHAFSRSRQDHAGKLADFNEALHLNPAHVYARFERGLARRRVGDEAGALEDFDAVLRLDPDFDKTYPYHAELQSLIGQVDAPDD